MGVTRQHTSQNTSLQITDNRRLFLSNVGIPRFTEIHNIHNTPLPPHSLFSLDHKLQINYRVLQSNFTFTRSLELNFHQVHALIPFLDANVPVITKPPRYGIPAMSLISTEYRINQPLYLELAGRNRVRLVASTNQVTRGSVVRGSVVRGSVVRGSVVRGSVVKGSVDKGSVVKGSVVKGSVVKGSVVRGSVVKGSVVWGSVVKGPSRRHSASYCNTEPASLTTLSQTGFLPEDVGKMFVAPGSGAGRIVSTSHLTISPDLTLSTALLDLTRPFVLRKTAKTELVIADNGDGSVTIVIEGGEWGGGDVRGCITVMFCTPFLVQLLINSTVLVATPLHPNRGNTPAPVTCRLNSPLACTISNTPSHYLIL